MIKNTLKTLIVTTTILMLSTSIAMAQDDVGGGEAAGGGVGGSTSTSTTTTTGIVLSVGPFITTTTVAGAAGGSASMEKYLRHNAVALQQDVRLGAGDTVTDLAQLFAVEPQHKAAFGKMLKANKTSLMPLMHTKTLTQKKAGQFIQTILGAMKQDKRFESSLKKLNKAS